MLPTDEQTQPEEAAADKPAGSPWRSAGKDQRPGQTRRSPNGRQNAARALFGGRPKNASGSNHRRGSLLDVEKQWPNQPVMVRCLGVLLILLYLRERSHLSLPHNTIQATVTNFGGATATAYSCRDLL
jgi:hypothetical protein